MRISDWSSDVCSSDLADIETLLIDEIGRLAVGMDHDMIGGAALGCKGGVHIGMGNVPVAGCIEIQRLGPPVRRLDGGGAGLLVHRYHLAPPPVAPRSAARRAGKTGVSP